MEGAMSVAFVFPGHGPNGAPVLHQLPAHPEVDRTIDEASEILGVDAASLDSGDVFRSAAAAQPALFIAGVATARALMAERTFPAAVAGLSVGSFGAAVACGTLSFADALPLVQVRGAMMDALRIRHGLIAVEGLEEPQVERLAAQVRTSAIPVCVASIEAPRRIVVAGSDAGLEALIAAARDRGARRIVRLLVNMPPHSPLFRPAAEIMEHEMAAVELRPPSVPYVSSRGGRVLHDVAAIRHDLAVNLAWPVRSYGALTALRDLGTNLFVEMAPGHASSILVSESFPAAKVVAIADQGLRQATLLATRENASSAISRAAG
jgi:malonate decarboxylase epsilon subunit